MPGPTDTHDDSPQRRLSLPLHSLRFRLAGGISLAVLLVGTGAGVLSWHATLDEVHDFQDEVLEQAARLVQPRSGTPLINLPAQGCALTDDDEEGLIVQRLPSSTDTPAGDEAHAHEHAQNRDREPDDDDDDDDDDDTQPSPQPHTTDAANTPPADAAPAALRLDKKPRHRQNASKNGDTLCLPLSSDLKNGYHLISHRGNGYRVYIHGKGSQRVAVAQDTRIRDEIARNSALYAALPVALLVPLLLGLVLLILHLMLHPLAALARTVDQRPDNDLQPLPHQNLPSELRPFVTAINRLLGRTEAAMTQQRRFVADAAHELRSPLAALSLQAERLQAAPMSAEAAERLVTLRAGLDRNRHLLDQLLSLARAQNAQHAGSTRHDPDTRHTPDSTQPSGKRTPTAPRTPVIPVLHRILEDLLPLADRKQINLGLLETPAPHGSVPESAHTASPSLPLASPPTTPAARSRTIPTGQPAPRQTGMPCVQADDLSLYTLLRNLVDNAIRYTPEGGQIDLWTEARAGRVLIGVEDNGPGIPADERSRVLDPFYRVLGTGQQGSGLGLSIVRTLIQNLGGELQLHDARHFPQGLCVEVTLPAADAQTGTTPPDT